MNQEQQHAFGIIGGVEFGMDRRLLTKSAKKLLVLGLVTTSGAHSGWNRSHFHWELTDAGRALLTAMVKKGAYPLATHTSVGRMILLGHP